MPHVLETTHLVRGCLRGVVITEGCFVAAEAASLALFSFLLVKYMPVVTFSRRDLFMWGLRSSGYAASLSCALSACRITCWLHMPASLQAA